MLPAQVSKTISVTIAGTLGSLLTQTEKNNITDLTITGTIDARDFEVMHDSLPELSNLNLKAVSIVAYYGNLGTDLGATTSYFSNSIPSSAFIFKKRITSLILPDSVEIISESAFESCSLLKTIALPSTVNSIDITAFNKFNGSIIVDSLNKNYSSLDGVLFDKSKRLLIKCPISKSGNYTIPSTVNIIGKSAFEWCDSIKAIYFPNILNEIRDFAFRGCSNISSITIPSSVSTIGQDVFQRCMELTDVTFATPSNLQIINAYTFDNCTSLLNIKIPSSVSSIINYAFSNCSGLSSIYIPTSVIDIGQAAFESCNGDITVDPRNSIYCSIKGVLYNKKVSKLLHCPISIKGTFTIPQTVDTLGWSAFSACANMTKVNFPSSLLCIGINAFNNCSSLTRVDLPPSVTSIGDCAFQYCTNLQSIKLPSSIISTGELMFAYCTKLSSINAYSITPINLPLYENYPSITYISNAFLNVDTNKCILYVPKGSLKLYQNSLGWKSFQNIQETSFEVSSDSLFLESKNGKAIIEIFSDTILTANSNQTWLTVNKDSNNLLLTISANQSTNTRTALIVVLSKGIKDTILVTQAAGDTALALSKDTLTFNDSISTKKIFVQSNAPWSVSSNVTWLTISPDTGSVSDSITITAQHNSTRVARTATITVISQTSVSLKSAIELTIAVVQSANSETPVIEVPKATILLYPNPAHSHFIINNNDEANIEIYNLNSQLVLQRKIVGNEPISLNNITTGVYFVKVITGNGVVTKRLVVE
jgi:hypothetical protein